MAKIHRSDAPLPQAPSVQVKASYTVTDLPKVSPQEPAAFYDQDNDEDYRRRFQAILAAMRERSFSPRSSSSAAACWSSGSSMTARPRASLPTCSR